MGLIGRHKLEGSKTRTETFKNTKVHGKEQEEHRGTSTQLHTIRNVIFSVTTRTLIYRLNNQLFALNVS